MLLSLQNVLMALPANYVPLSVIICIGTPNLHTIFLNTNLTALSCVIDLTASASAHFVKYSRYKSEFSSSTSYWKGANDIKPPSGKRDWSDEWAEFY